MVQLLEELPPELLAHIAGTIVVAAAAGRWAQASRASRLLLLPRLDQLLEARHSARQQAVLDKLNRPRRGSAAALEVYHLGYGDAAIHVLPHYLDSYVCKCCPVGDVRPIGYRLGCVNVHSGISLPRRIGQATDGTFMVWALPRPPGARLRRERPNLLTCSREQQAYSRHSTCG